MTVPQFRGMFNGDRSRKETLVNFGFRLPSALDNRPLKFDEFEKKMLQTIYTSATPAKYELDKSADVPAKVEYVSVLESCGGSAENAAYGLEGLKDGFALSARGVAACVTAPLSAFVAAKAADTATLVGVDYTVEGSGVSDFCLLDSETGLCLNKGKITLIEQKNISKYYVRFFARTNGPGEATVSYKDVKWFVAQPSQTLFLSKRPWLVQRHCSFPPTLPCPSTTSKAKTIRLCVKPARRHLLSR